MPRKKKSKAFIIQDSDEKEFVVCPNKFRNVAKRILAFEASSKQEDSLTNCAFKSLHDFYGDELDAGLGYSEDDYHYRHFNARQLGSLTHFLRKSIMKHRWNEAAQLTRLLAHPGITLYKTTIISTCFVLLLNHRNSNPALLDKFVRQCTHYILDEEVEKFKRIIFQIRDIPLSVQPVGKHARGKQMFKAVDEVCFDD